MGIETASQCRTYSQIENDPLITVNEYVPYAVNRLLCPVFTPLAEESLHSLPDINSVFLPRAILDSETWYIM